MATILKKCKVCGKEYEYCHTLIPGVFRWQDVACCREHALEYFAQVEAARASASSPVPHDNPEVVEEESPTVVEEQPVARKRSKKTASAKSTEE